MNEVFKPGQTVYLLYWRRPEERKLTRVGIWLTKKGRNNAMVDYLNYGLIVRPATWRIPARPPADKPEKVKSRRRASV